MAGQPVLLFCFLLPGILLSEGAKILTVCFVGGSHYLLMDQVSQILQDHGHDVTLLHQGELSLYSDFKEEKKSYQTIGWHPSEDNKKEFMKSFNSFMEKASQSRTTFGDILELIGHLGAQCNHFLRRKDIMDSLKNENFDLVVVEIFDFCPLLIAEKLGKPFVAILPFSFDRVDFGLPLPLSYVPVSYSLLTDRMDFWGRVKNFLMFFDFSLKQRQLHAQYDDAIREHFSEGSRPVLFDLLLKAELWFINSDFALDFARPLLPNTVYVGGLMVKPIKPVPLVIAMCNCCCEPLMRQEG